jgi:hypothetical protein
MPRRLFRSTARLAAALAGLALAVAGVAGAQEQATGPKPAPPPRAPLPDTWYTQALAYSEAGINVTHFWSRGRSLRAETVIAGHRVVTIVSADTYYAYDLLSRRGIAVKRTAKAMQQDAARARPFGNELDALLRHGGESIGTDEVGGRPVEVFQATDGRGRRQVWVTTDSLRLPIRLKIWRRSTGQTLHTDFLSWTRGLPIDAGFFEPEPDVAFERMSFEEYVAQQADRVPLGPVPVLYTDLLHGY